MRMLGLRYRPDLYIVTLTLEGRALISKSLKLISLLVLVQLVLVLLLWMKLESYEARIDELAQSAAPINNGEPVSITDTEASQDNSMAGKAGLDNQQLRLIIREELAAALSYRELAANNTTPAMEPPVYDELEMQYQRQLVLEELDALKGQAEVTGVELDKLMADIARLKPESRVEMIKKLNQALNRGEIKGNL